ncbi:hypothetical protein F8388_019649 [Cannabis sativa]|uniref:Translocase of chloroplast 159/132 membrane anchor domain-containing protein n=1 Tax=Cannabis sativa TaxID=3483 RepID=A0A7J6DVY1_CANSA|nr:hypothetical protein F8388_019649 [Cannabis sativa]KAF4350393.1 hypothetical protein G4B88_030911 [Cannabis sativa]
MHSPSLPLSSKLNDSQSQFDGNFVVKVDRGVDDDEQVSLGPKSIPTDYESNVNVLVEEVETKNISGREEGVAAMEQSTKQKILSLVKNVTKKCLPDIVLYVDRTILTVKLAISVVVLSHFMKILSVTSLLTTVSVDHRKLFSGDIGDSDSDDGEKDDESEEANFPISQDQLPIGLSLVKWKGDLALGADLQSQFSFGRNYKVVVRAGLSNKLSGQISICTSSSKQL